MPALGASAGAADPVVATAFVLPSVEATLCPALTDGFEAAFVGGALIAAVGVLVALFLVRRRDLEGIVEEIPEEAPALEAA